MTKLQFDVLIHQDSDDVEQELDRAATALKGQQETPGFSLRLEFNIRQSTSSSVLLPGLARVGSCRNCTSEIEWFQVFSASVHERPGGAKRDAEPQPS